jgi:hypothetical protein
MAKFKKGHIGGAAHQNYKPSAHKKSSKKMPAALLKRFKKKK